MKIVNKTEFPLIDDLINSLLEKFKNQGWQFPGNLPEIYLSDEIIQLPINKNGLQGLYPNIKMIPPNNNEAALLSDFKYKAETPIIIIYEKVLEETAKKLEEDEIYKRDILYLKREGIENDYGISFEEARINLFYCAVLNEISKWILLDTPKKNTWIDNPLNKTDNPVNKKDQLHECLTALLSYWICKEGSLELKKSFNFLMSKHKKGQNDIGKYNKYSEYPSTSFEIPSVINCIAICRKESYEYFELLDLLLEISEKDNTLNSNNFKTIIINIDIQKIVVKSFLKLTRNSEEILIDTMYKDFLNIQNQKSYGGFYSGIRFGI